ncbi:rhodanese-like domain-containing protein [Geobacillus zalihae]|uniref:rhodanese-like domain-containing protein n=1 Tax=Geobacillus zalihae TaxID=213419 RepID=UPI0009BEEE46|nr:rhodanese-like domain-containing protein [Geobacillus zalihae]OQP23031.1 rhodanese-like domain-containing protein [Geobacillus zalihae]
MEEIKEITPAEVKEKLERGEKLNIVDPDRLEEFDRNEEYIFVCRSGRRSENVCRYLQELGYRVRNMTGGMLEWEGETVPKR